MLLYTFGLGIQFLNEDDHDVAEWIALIFAGSLIATLFWVSACITYRLTGAHIHVVLVKSIPLSFPYFPRRLY